jgi:hypothetical protein
VYVVVYECSQVGGVQLDRTRTLQEHADDDVLHIVREVSKIW